MNYRRREGGGGALKDFSCVTIKYRPPLTLLATTDPALSPLPLTITNCFLRMIKVYLRIPGILSTGICLTPSWKHLSPGYTLRISVCFFSISCFTICNDVTFIYYKKEFSSSKIRSLNVPIFAVRCKNYSQARHNQLQSKCHAYCYDQHLWKGPVRPWPSSNERCFDNISEEPHTTTMWCHH